VLQLLSGDGPRFFLQWNSAVPLAFAGVLAWIAAAAALTLAVILSVTRMLLGNGTCALPHTSVLFSLTLAAAGVQSTASVRFL
jgi:hypothetical protein